MKLIDSMIFPLRLPISVEAAPAIETSHTGIRSPLRPRPFPAARGIAATQRINRHHTASRNTAGRLDVRCGFKPQSDRRITKREAVSAVCIASMATDRPNDEKRRRLISQDYCCQTPAPCANMSPATGYRELHIDWYLRGGRRENGLPVCASHAYPGP